jgi:signal peptidase II
MRSSRKSRLVLLFLILTCMVGCDQTSKHIARAKLGHLGAVALPGGFGELRLADNPGSFLSLGASLPDWLRMALFTFVVGAGLIVLFAFLAGSSRLRWISFLGLALVWAGGTSNLIDRITQQGFVTDFVLLRVGPLQTGVFNVADLLIVIGIVALFWSFGRGERQHDPPQRAERVKR